MFTRTASNVDHSRHFDASGEGMRMTIRELSDRDLLARVFQRVSYGVALGATCSIGLGCSSFSSSECAESRTCDGPGSGGASKDHPVVERLAIF
jgi:hypothetical protein